jgi:hypothetical protein
MTLAIGAHGAWTASDTSEVSNVRPRVVASMDSCLLRVFGPWAYLSAAFALAWSSALVGALDPEAVPTRVVPIPWAGS